MSYRNHRLGNAVTRGFGFAMGYALFQATLGILVGFWNWTAGLPSVARWTIRFLICALVVAGFVFIFSDF
jgi:hypothetical protein